MLLCFFMTKKKKPTQLVTTFEYETSLKGALSFNNKVIIKGQFEGSIITKGTLHIFEGANITADIHGHNVIIDGTVHGNCIADNCLEMSNTSYLKGNIKAKKLKLADGVKFEGKCEMIK